MANKNWTSAGLVKENRVWFASAGARVVNRSAIIGPTGRTKACLLHRFKMANQYSNANTMPLMEHLWHLFSGPPGTAFTCPVFVGMGLETNIG